MIYTIIRNGKMYLSRINPFWRKPRPIYPLFWWSKFNPITGIKESDRGFVCVIMDSMPDEKKQEVADNYDRLFKREGREAANDYLRDEAEKEDGR